MVLSIEKNRWEQAEAAIVCLAAFWPFPFLGVLFAGWQPGSLEIGLLDKAGAAMPFSLVLVKLAVNGFVGAVAVDDVLWRSRRAWAGVGVSGGKNNGRGGVICNGASIGCCRS